MSSQLISYQVKIRMTLLPRTKPQEVNNTSPCLEMPTWTLLPEPLSLKQTWHISRCALTLYTLGNRKLLLYYPLFS